LLTEELCVASLLLLRRKSGKTIRKPLISPRRQATQVLTRGADQILPRHNIISLKALEMDGLIRRSGSRR
jgi:hypothetical protein